MNDEEGSGWVRYRVSGANSAFIIHPSEFII
jgi:hypothetical protein